MNFRTLDVPTTLNALKISVYDGIFAQSFAILTGSIFLPAFALILNASDFQIGLLASIPFFATFSQLFGAYFVEKYQNRKTIVLLSVSLARAIWLPITLVSFFLSVREPVWVLRFLIIAVIGYHLLAALSGVSWLSWMSLLVPEEIRGRYFGLRNSILSSLTITMTVLGGYYLDWFGRSLPGLPKSRAFEIIFLLAVIFSGISIYFLTRQPEVNTRTPSSVSLRHRFLAPLRDKRFTHFLRFGSLWSFGVNFASPFFIVYMLKDLHLSYTLLSLLTVASALADLIGMWAWGHFSDQIGNRPVIFITAFAAAVLPLLWVFTNDSFGSIFIVIPVLHIAGGFVWAGYNLCAVNLLFRTAPEKGNSVYFALWNFLNGIAAGLGAISGGLFSTIASGFSDFLSSTGLSNLKIIFLISFVLRLLAFLQIKNVREEKGVGVIKAIRVLRSIRSWTTMMGFHPVLHFFLPARRNPPEKSPYWPLWSRKSSEMQSE